MCDDNFGSTWDPFGTHNSGATRRNRRMRHGNYKPGDNPELDAEIEAEIAANQRTALVRRRRLSSSLFGAGRSVLGSAAVTPGVGGGTALGGGGPRGGGGGGRGGYGQR